VHVSEISFNVKVIDGEGLPVPDVEVGARYKYVSGPRTWSAEHTDGDGLAEFHDDHAEKPTEVELFVDEQDCGCYPVFDGEHITLEM
jgi:hypothetical protein